MPADASPSAAPARPAPDAPSAAAPRVRQLVLKVHSRCNLACDYCYVYRHADQGWRDRPRVIAPATVDRVADRLAAHVARHGTDRVRVVLHGGEPLLAGAAVLDRTVRTLRTAMPTGATLDVAMQTNGVLLDEAMLALCHTHGIDIGVSLDGDRTANDRYRRHADGRGSFTEVAAALRLLARPEHRARYAGLLCTVDLANDPVVVYRSLREFDPPLLDLLLPHGNWTAPPPGRRPGDPATPYADWLIAVFDTWYRETPRRTGIRLFESLIALLLGGRSGTQALGATDPDIMTIETDGTIEGTDTLKTTTASVMRTGLDVFRHTFDEALGHPSLAGRPTGIAALAPACRTCPVVGACGGGLYAHRFRDGAGFAHPSVYCADLFRLIRHVQSVVAADVDALRRTVVTPPAGATGAGRAGAPVPTGR
ncbi:FxsB family radical SAM/SPASM domain protein [Micromonospora sp. RHAY321]|uniref:FxsB family cyclophane-forming radical SAM/SPASM peptide maturase n=1 Tax=Micromonospora sp. RHAY321 TaxID=2944807 RepID=UPI00207D36CA|nr:FxsB family cyclophane-forming radical SAM/SPASM peptide maturase [Micromonospora sp. RHAY321]MCO1594849.1 FxsB family radical SAM/SPASM domain protein [Micromonospora sp. RHAY321]